VPGVQVRRTGAASDLSTASVRGATSQQLPVYLAGVLLNDDVHGGVDLSTLPLWMLDRAEVFRGNAPEHADRLGIAGAVFLEPRLPQQSRVGGGIEIGSFGAFDSFIGAEVAALDASSLVAVRRSVAENDYEFLDNKDTWTTAADDTIERRPNADFEGHDVWTIGRYLLDSRGTRLTLGLNAFDREQGVSGVLSQPAEHTRARTRRSLGFVSSKLPCRFGAGSCNVHLSSSLVLGRQSIEDPLNELNLIPNVVARSERFAQTARFTQRLGHDLVLGALLTQEVGRLRIERGGSELVDARRQATNLAFTTRYRLTRSLEPFFLVSFSCHVTRGPASRGTCGTPAPQGRVGIAAELTPALTLLGNVGHYIRVPTLGELYGLSFVLRGNSALEPETGTGADLGVRAFENGRFGSVWLDGFAFARRVDGLIAYRRTSLRGLSPFNIGQARMLGLELGLGSELMNHLATELALTLLDARDITPERRLENDLIPFQSRLTFAQSVQVFAEEPIPGVMMLDRLSLGFGMEYRSSRFADPGGLVVIAGHPVFDAEAAAFFWRRQLALRLAVKNLSNTRLVDLIGFPLPGRSLHANLEVWLF
jgi:iron complex outermembrane receptor protein